MTEQKGYNAKIIGALSNDWQNITEIAKNSGILDLKLVSHRVCLFCSFGTVERETPIHTKNQKYRLTPHTQQEQP